MASNRSAADGPRDLVVVSDLHLGRGQNPATKRWHRLETFLYDEDFHAFCRWLCQLQVERGAPLALVLNGDTFDFLRIEPEPVPGAWGSERRYGPAPTAEGTARMVLDILGGHEAFVDGLAAILAAGHEVIILPGNHDLEVQFDQVQAAIRRLLSERLARRGAPVGAAGRLRFGPWFLYEPGRIWIEHGCQYDPENAFRYPLRRALAGAAIEEEVASRDLPLGNFFQRYLYNAFGHIAFIVPSSRANYRYFRWLLANRPRLLARVFWSHAPFLIQLLRRLGKGPDVAWQAEADTAHRAELGALAASSGLGERLAVIDGLKHTGADAAHAAAGILRQLSRLVFGAAAAAVLAAAFFAAATTAIGALEFGAGWKALLLLALYLVSGTGIAAGLVAAALRMPGERQLRPLRAAAAEIGRVLEVSTVVFGHSHEEVIAPLARAGDRRFYFNTGTWIAVFTHDVLLPRERVQFTFLRVEGDDAELLHWSPQRGRPLPVILLEEDGDTAMSPDPASSPAPSDRA